MQFDEVKPEHFSTISRDPFPHILIDRALLQISGGDARAAKFRVDALAAAGGAVEREAGEEQALQAEQVDETVEGVGAHRHRPCLQR